MFGRSSTYAEVQGESDAPLASLIVGNFCLHNLPSRMTVTPREEVLLAPLQPRSRSAAAAPSLSLIVGNFCLHNLLSRLTVTPQEEVLLALLRLRSRFAAADPLLLQIFGSS